MTVKRPLAFLLSALPAILCMVLIFTFSAQTAEISSKTSGDLIERHLSLLPSGFDDMSAAPQEEIVESLQFIVRKGAHFTVYALLGMLCMAPAFVMLHRLTRSAFAAWGIAVLYAVTDEIHQYFVPGRSCEVRDVLIDAGGAALGILCLLGVAGLILRRKKSADRNTKNTTE